MNPHTPVSHSYFRRWLCLLAGLAIVGGLLWFYAGNGQMRETSSTNNPPSLSPASPAALAAVEPTTAGNSNPTRPASRLPVLEFAWFQAHPFAATQTNGAYQWTTEDGKDTNVIRQLAHNELEYRRMVLENPTIYRRQLVYHPEGFTLTAQRAVQSGETIRQLTLPGIDGQEIQVLVTRTDFESQGGRGIFYGILPGDPDALVTAAFINDREAFTVMSRKNQIFLHGEAREPGELVVKQIDPNIYASQACGNE